MRRGMVRGSKEKTLGEKLKRAVKETAQDRVLLDRAIKSFEEVQKWGKRAFERGEAFERGYDKREIEKRKENIEKLRQLANAAKTTDAKRKIEELIEFQKREIEAIKLSRKAIEGEDIKKKERYDEEASRLFEKQNEMLEKIQRWIENRRREKKAGRW